MKAAISITPSPWGWLWYREDGYLSIGLGPFYLQFEWIDEGRI